MNQLLYEGKAKNIKEAAREHKSSIVGMNALLTTTMPYMKVVIDGFAKEEDLKHIKMCVGGAPVSEMFAEETGADGYAPMRPRRLNFLMVLSASKSLQLGIAYTYCLHVVA